MSVNLLEFCIVFLFMFGGFSALRTMYPKTGLWLSTWWPVIKCQTFHIKRKMPARCVERVKGLELHWECTKCESVRILPLRVAACEHVGCLLYSETIRWDFSKKPCRSCAMEGHYPLEKRTHIVGATISQDADTGDLFADFGVIPKWVSPCDGCGGNCGQCASSHCGICGVKPRDGECDQVKHMAYKIHTGEAR